MKRGQNQKPTGQTDDSHSTAAAKFKERHPKLAELGRKLHDGAVKVGHELQERHDERVRHDEEVREQVRDKNQSHTAQPDPKAKTTKDATPTTDYNAEYSRHKKLGDTAYAFKQYSNAITEYDLALKYRAQARNISVQNTILYALAGLSALLSDSENENLYICIAECYMQLKQYDLALKHLEPIRSRPVAQSMIESCNRHLQENSSGHTKPIQPKQQEYVAPRIWWLDHRGEYLKEAKRLLEYAVPENAEQSILGKGMNMLLGKKEIASLPAFTRELAACISIYTNNSHEPTVEESDLHGQLVTMQSQLQQFISAREAEEDARRTAQIKEADERLRQEKIASDKSTALFNEPIIIAQLQQAQTELAANNFESALVCLNKAHAAAKGDHAQYFTRDELKNTSIFVAACSDMTMTVSSFKRTKSTNANLFAEHVVDSAFPADKRLFHVHRDRIIKAMQTYFEAHMHKFAFLQVNSLSLIPMFERMRDLLIRDGVNIDNNKWFGRGGWLHQDKKQLVHSDSISLVLQRMIAMEPLRPTPSAFVNLDIFTATKTVINLPLAEPGDHPDMIDWYATLCNSGQELIYRASQQDPNVQVALVAGAQEAGYGTFRQPGHTTPKHQLF